jgi:hypothetical protein
MTDPAPKRSSTPRPVAAAAPTITAMAGGVITGAGFLPDHEVVVCVNYVADDISDYLTYTADASGHLYAEVPTSAATGTMRVAATDRRTDPNGRCGLLWSNTDILRP